MPDIIVLVGQRCAGKTLLGRELASLLDRGFRDLDGLVAEAFGGGGAGIGVRAAWLALGEGGFRALEADVLRGALTAAASVGEAPLAGAAPCGAAARGLVLATGGGLADNPAGLEALRAAMEDAPEGDSARREASASDGRGRPRLLVLRAPLELLLPRYRERGFPPSLGSDPGPAAVRELFERREAAYASLAALPGAVSLELAASGRGDGEPSSPPLPELARRAASLLGLDPGRSGDFR